MKTATAFAPERTTSIWIHSERGVGIQDTRIPYLHRTIAETRSVPKPNRSIIPGDFSRRKFLAIRAIEVTRQDGASWGIPVTLRRRH
ncbi:MAG: hypothetical protein IKZ71_04960 [Bacteroidales bacterium]|nr:hypothetical protein [Bacteroidales bacterium]